MSDEIELITDGDGLAVIGDPAVVDRFLTAHGLPSRDLGLGRIQPVLSAAGGALHAGSAINAASGRWVKLTEESARAFKDLDLMKGSTAGVSRAVTTENGKITGILEIATRGSVLTNPAVLAGAAGIMAQLAMQQAMDEITDYLAVIDQKVDDVLRNQKDQALASMIGVDLVIEDALTAREHVGRVSDVTWSKVQSTSLTVATTQAYAVRQLDAATEKLERSPKVGDLARATKEAERTVQEWLAVLARCFQLQDAIAVLELDRVLDASPEELDRHRVALQIARQNREDLIAETTRRLMTHLDAAATTANAKVLLHPTAPKAVVQSTNQINRDVLEFHARLGITGDRDSLEARRWVDAATEARDLALATGADGLEVARQLGSDTLGRARSVTGRFAEEIAERRLRARGGGREADHDG